MICKDRDNKSGLELGSNREKQTNKDGQSAG